MRRARELAGGALPMLLVSPQLCVQPRSDCHTIVTCAGPSSYDSGILIARNTSDVRPIAMNKPNAFLKAAVLLSSVLLLSAFVSYRAGAFDRFLNNTGPPSDFGGDPLPQENLSGDSTSEGIPGSVTNAEPPPSSRTDGDRTIMSSSKSIILPDGKGIVTATNDGKGSVTFTVTDVAPNTAQAQPPAPPAPPAATATERQRSILPGSKSGTIVPPPSINAPATPPPSPNQSTKPSR
jgi:hypothetical protein